MASLAIYNLQARNSKINIIHNLEARNSKIYIIHNLETRWSWGCVPVGVSMGGGSVGACLLGASPRDLYLIDDTPSESGSC